MKSVILVGALVLLIPAALAAAQELPKLNVTLMSCTELECVNQKDVFLVNESAYLDYNSTVKNISYSATITFPDGTRYQTTFPNRIISNITGNYTVDIIAWAEGYQDTTVSKEVRFAEKSSPASQNPVTINPVPLLAIAAAIILVFGLWRYSKRGKPQTSKKKKR
jgi:hypothetical protein